MEASIKKNSLKISEETKNKELDMIFKELPILNSLEKKRIINNIDYEAIIKDIQHAIINDKDLFSILLKKQVINILLSNAIGMINSKSTIIKCRLKEDYGDYNAIIEMKRQNGEVVVTGGNTKLLSFRGWQYYNNVEDDKLDFIKIMNIEILKQNLIEFISDSYKYCNINYTIKDLKVDSYNAISINCESKHGLKRLLIVENTSGSFFDATIRSNNINPDEDIEGFGYDIKDISIKGVSIMKDLLDKVLLSNN